MPRHLLVLRHASAESRGDQDLERRLTERGREEAQRIAAWVERNGWNPDILVSSPARRARETAESVCTALGLNADEIRLDDRLYDNRLSALDAVLADHAAAATVLLVGHNPGLEDLVDRLTGGAERPDGGQLLAPGALAVVRLDTHGQETAATVEAVVRPDQAAAGGQPAVPGQGRAA